MIGDGVSPDIDWRDGTVPYSRRFNDVYFDQSDGYAESVHVFLSGNDLPARFRAGFHIAELGFGTGLNMLSALRLWRDSGTEGQFRFTSFEAFPLSRDAMHRALGRFADRLPVEEFLAAWQGVGKMIEMEGIQLEVISGDARLTLPAWEGVADAWFLDGFAPARNPEIWSPKLMAEVAQHTRPGGSFATFSAAGTVRRALSVGGFVVQKCDGFGRKQHMCRGVLASKS
ncbi:MAG: tRNA (5-methylaminomethyl-2-thiouridine)(34)-methyltransferase MnmD [Rhodobacteraceae bacterium]|nr:tRNA (5-methylaminomethyl-2-thiouridine)(34)-methyltransferase MnmD [Paracoccaceae bacterium]